MAQRMQLDLEGIRQNNQMWLVKVPKYLSQQWHKASGRGELGKLRITNNQRKTELSFTLNEELTNIDIDGQPGPATAPREHQFFLQELGGQILTVLTEGAQDKLSLAGTVVQRMECRPAVGENYMRLKRMQIKESSKPARTVQKLDKVVTTNYKPVANHHYNIEYEKKKKEDGKRVRIDKDQVLTVLFSAFEKHQYYNVKDLVDITGQPVEYLKEILNEIGVRNVKGPHKNTWELKAEYQHYPAAAKSEEENPLP
ncbi:general transcription factor IIF subunit 2-like [Choloepus didactylus]|uniref:general transcription factor IIF subunit 2-like n=1 Tax=Choloepus didactylus TaxID=27675 RepID=UPI00189D0152|nr:general transcription factor IIF subunit 2-like [Choloepus didactylus]